MPKPKTDLASAVHDAGRSVGPGLENPSPELRRRAYRPPSREKRRGIVIHVIPELRKTLRQIALDEDTTLQALGEEAFERLVRERYRS